MFQRPALPILRGMARRPEIVVCDTPEAASRLALAELERHLRGRSEGLVSFATGSTFAAMFEMLNQRILAGELPQERLFATHLDEYLGFSPEDEGGMARELFGRCPILRDRHRCGAFLLVPGSRDGIAGHEQAIAGAGGVALQFLGIGRNGHLAFNEPGTPFDSGFHVAELAETTREDARARFAPRPVPRRAVTAGLGTILAARRLVLCAFGAAKAPAVGSMIEGPVEVSCPASSIRLHENALVLLDREAASGLAASSAVAHG
ncbi:MAG: glucosamine-6-phosphate deaminase [Planctomycetota bacterium]